MRDYYRILDPLGAGAYGEVRKCIYKDNILDIRSSLKSFRAVKVLSKSYMEEKDRLSFQNEVTCLYRLNFPEGKVGDSFDQGHPNILKLYHYFEDEKRYMLVTELIEGEDLFARMKSQKRKLTGIEKSHIIK